MYFQIRKLVLWSRKDHSPREIVFKTGQVNVISGASKTGKSAVIPIVDYCLGSHKCGIPVGVIRESCSWFGVLISTVEGEILLARREPGDQKQTGDMFIVEGDTVEIPNEIAERNSNTAQAKTILNRISGLSTLGMDPTSEGYGADRTSFRDLMAFAFQPQNIVANPDVLFFKADTTEHREKLKSIFPYVLNAATQETLAMKWELERLRKLLRSKESALREAASSVEVWRGEATSWIQSAVDLGLVDKETQIPEDWPELVDFLRALSQRNYRDATPSVAAMDSGLKELENLRNLESQEASTLSSCRQRLLEVRRLVESSRSYGDAIKIQRDRLSIADWLNGLSDETNDPLSNVATPHSAKLNELCDTLRGLELELRSQATISDKLDKEQLRMRALAEETIARLNDTRAQIVRLERRSEEAREAAYRADRIERYLGRLEQALKLYEEVGLDAELSLEVGNLQQRINSLREKVSEQQIRNKIDNALDSIQLLASQIVSELDVEWPNAAIKFVIQDLTVKVVHGNRDDYLWEIGSGANWLAYHVAMSLAFHKFFLESPHHPVPSFIVYDQPSQVYFPQSLRPQLQESDAEPEWRDEDVVAVRKVFNAVSDATLDANSRLQVILLDHADQNVWSDIDNVYLVEEWRDGKKLVPETWLSN